MSCMLLLGAGFSRNWGGWLAAEAFEYLIGCPEINADPNLSELLWRNQHTGGFENALAELQALTDRDPAMFDTLQQLRGAVLSMFDVMNGCFQRLVNFEPENNNAVRRFLFDFDAIFTLNQDLLLEYQYLNMHPELLAPQRRQGYALPGMRPVHDPLQAGAPGGQWSRRWMPANPDQFNVDPELQPYFKLHGSSNWQQDDAGRTMLIMGGGKAKEIGLVPVLQWYQEKFTEYLCRGDARLMVIGYGFRDEHINAVIIDAIENYGLKLFVVSPDGADQARRIAPSAGGMIRDKTPLEHAFERGLVGASRRSIPEIFNGRQAIELSKLLRFVQR